MLDEVGDVLAQDLLLDPASAAPAAEIWVTMSMQ